MYRLHIANKNYSSWSLRAWVLMRELAIPFEEDLHRFDAGAAFRSFSPNSLVPCLEDGELRIWDSLAIAEYLAEHHSSVWPADSTARAWARSLAAEMHSGFFALRRNCSMNCGVRVRLAEFPVDLAADLVRMDGAWREGLDRFGGPFLAGPAFTAVDAFFAPVAFRVQTYGLTVSPFSTRYIKRLLALPAMREWYAAALAEPWRDLAHEESLVAAGRILDDFRRLPVAGG